MHDPKVGDYVTYPRHSEWPRSYGRVTRVTPGDPWCGVCFDCSGEWDRTQHYTSQRVEVALLRVGWVGSDCEPPRYATDLLMARDPRYVDAEWRLRFAPSYVVDVIFEADMDGPGDGYHYWPRGYGLDLEHLNDAFDWFDAWITDGQDSWAIGLSEQGGSGYARHYCFGVYVEGGNPWLPELEYAFVPLAVAMQPAPLPDEQLQATRPRPPLTWSPDEEPGGPAHLI